MYSPHSRVDELIKEYNFICSMMLVVDEILRFANKNMPDKAERIRLRVDVINSKISIFEIAMESIPDNDNRDIFNMRVYGCDWNEIAAKYCYAITGMRYYCGLTYTLFLTYYDLLLENKICTYIVND